MFIYKIEFVWSWTGGVLGRQVYPQVGLALVVLILRLHHGDISSPFDAFGASDCDTVPLYCATERKLVFWGFQLLPARVTKHLPSFL